jgi:hypothetical protein
MPAVVVSAPFRLVEAHGQQRRGPVQRLDLALLVDADHDRVLWRVEIQTDDIADLRFQLRVVENLNVSTRCGCRPQSRQIRATSAKLTGIPAFVR